MYGKKDILELYLNKVYFGDGLYGVEAAARGYFGKSSSDLTVDEAALLAGLIQSPSSYAPTVNLDRAIARRNVVLQTMVSSGAIDQATAERAKTDPCPAEERARDQGDVRPLFQGAGPPRAGRAIRLAARLSAAGCACSPRSTRSCSRRPRSWSKRPRRHRAASAAIHTCRGPSSRRPRKASSPQYLQGALVAMDPTTGYVRAMVGGRDFDESHFNRAVQAKRQAGSAFKPFVYAAALEAGYTPASVITNLDDPIATPQGGWVPEDEHSTADSMTMRTALRTSSNRAAVQMLNTRRDQERGQLRAEAERRNAAERAVARARRERSHAHVAHRRLRRVRRQRHRPPAGPDPPGRGQRRQGAVSRTRRSRTGRSAKRPRS